MSRTRTAAHDATASGEAVGRWTRVPTPEPGTAQALELPLSIALCVAVFVLWALLTPLDAIAVDRAQLVEIAFALPPLHAVMRGMSTRSGTTYEGQRTGFARAVAPLAHDPTIGVSRARYLATLALPLCALSIVPVVLSALTGRTPGEIVACSLFNALASGGDALAAILVLTQVPAAALVRGTADGVAWRPAPAALSERVERLR